MNVIARHVVKSHLRLVRNRDFLINLRGGPTRSTISPPSPLLERVGPVGLVAAVVEAVLVAQGRKRVPGRVSLVSRVSRIDRARRAGAESRAAGLPSVGMSKPLCARGLPDATGASASIVGN